MASIYIFEWWLGCGESSSYFQVSESFQCGNSARSVICHIYIYIIYVIYTYIHVYSIHVQYMSHILVIFSWCFHWLNPHIFIPSLHGPSGSSSATTNPARVTCQPWMACGRWPCCGSSRCTVCWLRPGTWKRRNAERFQCLGVRWRGDLWTYGSSLGGKRGWYMMSSC